MYEEEPSWSDAYEYVMTSDESARWGNGDDSDRLELLNEIAQRLFRETREPDCDQFVIYDKDGSIIAKIKLEPMKWQPLDPNVIDPRARLN